MKGGATFATRAEARQPGWQDREWRRDIATWEISLHVGGGSVQQRRRNVEVCCKWVGERAAAANEERSVLQTGGMRWQASAANRGARGGGFRLDN